MVLPIMSEGKIPKIRGKPLQFPWNYGMLLDTSGGSGKCCNFAASGPLKGTSNMNLFLTIIQVICGLAVIAVVMLQSGKSAGLSGAIAGGADTFLSKNKAKSLDAKLARWTKWVAILWIIITLVLSLV